MKKMRRSLLLQSVMLVVGMVVSGCAAYSQTAAAPKTEPPGPATQPLVSLSPAMPVTTDAPADPAKLAEPAGTKPPSEPVSDSFVLGAEDQITVSMWDEPKFDGVYIIRPDGKIMVKLIGEIQAAGLTPVELCDTINKASASLLKTPRCNINVTGVHSKHVYFDGEGISPGAMDLVIPTHLLEGISARGGFKDFADKKHIKILRDGKLFITVNYKDLISGKSPEKNILLQDKDHVIVN
jgi:polysaccharide export outer membrane protein